MTNRPSIDDLVAQHCLDGMAVAAVEHDHRPVFLDFIRHATEPFMPDLQLGPDDYRVKTKRGNWTARDRPWMFIIAGLVFIGFLVFTWWHRSELSTATLFGACALFSFFVGMAVAAWVKRFD